MTRSRLWESAVLLLVAFSLLRPGFWWDRIFPAEERAAPQRLEQIAGDLPAGAALTVFARGMNLEGDEIEKRVRLPMGAVKPGGERLSAAGLTLRHTDGRITVDMVEFGSPAFEAGLDLDWSILSVVVETDRPAKQWLYPLLVAPLLVVAGSQRRRRAGDDVRI